MNLFIKIFKIPEIGEPCTKAGECYTEKDIENVECRNSVCQCKFGYQANDQRTCIRVVPNKKSKYSYLNCDIYKKLFKSKQWAITKLVEIYK